MTTDSAAAAGVDNDVAATAATADEFVVASKAAASEGVTRMTVLVTIVPKIKSLGSSGACSPLRRLTTRCCSIYLADDEEIFDSYLVMMGFIVVRPSSTLVNQGILSSAQSIVRYSICSIDNSTPARYWPRVVPKGDEYPLALSSEV